MAQSALFLDEEMFLTKLALTILDGRSFNIAGKKCSFESLFPANSMDDEASPPSPDGDGEAEEQEAEPDKPPFVSQMMAKINNVFDWLYKKELERVARFRKNKLADSKLSKDEMIKLYQESETHLDVHCKGILTNIQTLQNQFEDVSRMKEVTDNLESLSQVVNFN